jgi:uncharacterized membrane protein HdeD (DUF308 family)
LGTAARDDCVLLTDHRANPSFQPEGTMTAAMPHVSALASNWWALALRGVVAILVGVLAFTMPNITLAALVLLFGAYAIVDGVLAVAAALRGLREHERWGWMLAEGIVSIVAGLIVFVMPGIGALAIIWLVAAWALATGAFEIAAAIRLRKLIEGEWMLLLAGVLSVILGVVIAIRPGIGAAVIVTWIGIYALFAGIVTLVLAFRIRKWAHEHA